MSTVYTPNAANNPSTYVQPSDGDNANAASVLGMMEALADKSAFLAALWKPYVIARSNTVVTSALSTSGSNYPLVTSTFPAISLLATDLVVVVAVCAIATSAASSFQYSLQSNSGAVIDTSATVNLGGVNVPSNVSVVCASPPSLAGVTGLTVYGSPGGGSATLNSARMFAMIFRQG